jgi:hypothetical protein
MWYDAGEGMSASDSETAAEIVPFPAARRAGHVRSMARLLLSYSPEGAERTQHCCAMASLPKWLTVRSERWNWRSGQGCGLSLCRAVTRREGDRCRSM